MQCKREKMNTGEKTEIAEAGRAQIATSPVRMRMRGRWMSTRKIQFTIFRHRVGVSVVSAFARELLQANGRESGGLFDGKGSRGRNTHGKKERHEGKNSLMRRA